MKLLTVFALVLSLASVARAQSPIIHTGAGSLSCGEWLAKDGKDGTAAVVASSMMLSWVQGYVVGYAQAMTVVLIPREDRQQQDTVSGWIFDPPDASALRFWLTKYCRDNPLERINSAAIVLVGELTAKQ